MIGERNCSARLRFLAGDESLGSVRIDQTPLHIRTDADILVSVTENRRPKFWPLQMLFGLILATMGILSLAGVIAVPVPVFLGSILLIYLIDNRDRISAKLHRLR